MDLSKEVVTKLRDWDNFSKTFAIMKKSQEINIMLRILTLDNFYFRNSFHDDVKVSFAFSNMQ